MEITLRRCKMQKEKNYTIGHLYVDGKYVCDTIEDKDRGLTQEMPLAEIQKQKIMAQTAIPKGQYRVTLDVCSPKFRKKPYYRQFCGGYLPRLLNVPGFEGILIHKGASERDSAGCLILGRNTVVGKVTHSQECFEQVYELMRKTKEDIWIRIC